MPYLPNLLFNDHVLNISFGVHTSLTSAGIPSNRIVNYNTEASTVSESITDQASVGYAATPGAVASFAGVVIDGCSPLQGTLLPGFNRDRNVTVGLLGVFPVEVVPGAVIAQGSIVNVDAVGRAAATGTATTFVTINSASGVGTATNPEYILVVVR